MSSLARLVTMKLAVLAVLAVLAMEARASAATLVVEPGFTEANVGKSLDVGYDPTGLLTFDEVRSGKVQFAPSTKDVPSFGYRTGATWARFAIDDRRSPEAESLVLEHGYGQTDRLEVFDFVEADSATSAPRLRLSGDQVRLAEWENPGRFPRFSVPRGRREFYVKSVGTHSHQLPFSLRTRTVDEAHRRSDVLAQSLFFGALLIMAAYNALVAAATRSRPYAYYVAYLLSYGIASMSLGGLLVFAEPSRLPLLNFMVPWFLALAEASSLWFALALLGLDRRRGWGFGVFGLGAAILPVVGAAGVFSYPLALRLMLVASIPWAILLVGAGVSEARRGSRVAGLFLLAWGAFIAGVLVNLGRVLGALPFNGLTANAMQVGSALEFLLLSFALADRIKQLQSLATANAELAADNARAAQAASDRSVVELLRLDRLRGEFLANTSHELRTPLNGVIGLAEALYDSPELAPVLRGKTTEILGASRRLAALVATILDFTAAPTGDAFVPAPVNLQTAANRIVADVAGQAAAQGLRVTCDLGAGTDAVLGGEHHLEQVLRALLSNAIKFSHFGNIQLRARRVGADVNLAISDEGCGMSEDALANLFHAFEQGDGSATRTHGGLGLGLVTARKLILEMGGTIAIQSAVGVGTVVSVSLPASEVIPEPPVPLLTPLAVAATQNPPAPMFALPGSPEPLPAVLAPARIPSLAPARLLPVGTGSGLGRRARLLIVDDDRINRLVIVQHLQNTPFDWAEAASGAEALTCFRDDGPFDAVLLDVMMPGMSGYDVCTELRKMVSAADVPILMLTAKDQPKDLLVGFEAGANDYVHKPISKGELLARVTCHVRLARSSAAMRRFVPNEMIRLLGHDDLTEVALGDSRKQRLTISFSDVRGFTKAVEHLSPEQTFAWLNGAFGVIGPVVRNHRGFVDKYIGDAVMALFPVSPVDAIHAAISMQRGLDALGGVRLGTGLHLGPTMIGTLGEAERFEATVLSDAVNVASRVEGATKLFGVRVLVTKEVHAAAVGEDFHWRALGRVRFKGRAKAEELFELLDCDPDDERDGKLAFIQEFQEGIDAFAEGSLREALLRFEHIVNENPDDAPAIAYQLHTTNLLATGDPNFDGAFVLAEK